MSGTPGEEDYFLEERSGPDLARILIYAVSALLGSIVVIVSYGIGAAPLVASGVIAFSLLAYALSLSFFPEYRRVFLASAVGAHISAVLLYYSNPIPLPFLIIERSPEGMSLNIDLVQLVIAYEYLTSKTTREIEEASQESYEETETIKSPAEKGLDSRRAPEEPR